MARHQEGALAVVQFRSAAARELIAAFRYYEGRYPGRGTRFLEAVENALGEVARAPRRHPLHYAPDIRSRKVKRFPYRIVYVELEGTIDVVAVAHAKRRPAYWRE